MINDGYLKVTKANFEAKHQEVLEIYKRIYNQPNEARYSECIDDANPDDCWFKVEPAVSDDPEFASDKPNLKTRPEAIVLGMQTGEE